MSPLDNRWKPDKFQTILALEFVHAMIGRRTTKEKEIN
jgi:hypothetical protein